MILGSYNIGSVKGQIREPREGDMSVNRICRVCNREYKFADGYEWLQAVPDGLSGEKLRANVQWWCSRECRDNDPQYQPLDSGEALLDMINRLKAGAGPVPGDIGEFFADGSGLSREEIAHIADEILCKDRTHAN